MITRFISFWIQFKSVYFYGQSNLSWKFIRMRIRAVKLDGGYELYLDQRKLQSRV